MFVLLVPNLAFGGTERQVTLLGRSLHSAGYPVTIATFRPGGTFETELKADGVNVVPLGGPQSGNPLQLVAALRKLLRKSGATALYSFLPAANVLASVAALGMKNVRLVWSVRSADMPLQGYGLKTRGAYALERWMSRFPNWIVANSHAGRAASARKGFPDQKLLVIENGFDTTLFRPDREARARIRSELGLDEQNLLIGLSGRLDPVKGHETFLRAAKTFSTTNPHARFVCIGGAGPDDHVAKLHALARSLELGDRLIWTGDRGDMPKFLPALDIANLCSSSEGFPNVVGEAMACAVPCVVSDVGDAGVIVGDARFILKPGDVEALRMAWDILSDRDERERVGHAAHARIVENYSLDRLVSRTAEVLNGGR